MSGTAEIHDAVLDPDKTTLLRRWLAEQPWFPGDASGAEKVGSYRFVDPAGEVGIECFLVHDGGVTFHVPVTYRAEPLVGVDHALVGVLEHSVLGTRYVYDAHVDPVFLGELERVIREADSAAEWHFVEAGRTEPSPVDARGSGLRSTAEPGEPEIVRVLPDTNANVDGAPEAAAAFADAAGTLVARWDDGSTAHAAVVAVLR